MTGTTIAIAAATSANAAAATAARQARISHCMSLNSPHPVLETVEQKREYADCIRTLYPDPMSTGEVLAVKAAIVFVFLATVVRGWIHRDSWEGPGLGALGGFCFGAAVVVGVLLLYLGGEFLING